MQSKTIEFLTFSLVFIPIFIWTILYFSENNYTKGFMGILSIALLTGLAFWQKKSALKFPSAFISLIYIFIFAAIGLGTFGGFYKLTGYDDVLHFLSGILTGYAAWFLLLSLEGEKTVIQLSHKFIILYLIAFVMAAAGFWELLEFAGDTFLNFTAQGRDHVDTMMDMIDGLLGGITFCFIFIYFRKKRA